MPAFIAMHAANHDLDAFTQGYLECAEWLAQADNETGEMSDDDRHDCEGFHPDAIASAKIDCEDFQTANAADLRVVYLDFDPRPSAAGYNFYLSRNGHGAGFIDVGHQPVFRALHNAARVYGSADCTYYDGFLHLD